MLLSLTLKWKFLKNARLSQPPPSYIRSMKQSNWLRSSVQSLSRVWLCDPMDCSIPGFPVYHQLPEFTQAHVHWISDAIQPSHPLSSPSPTALNLSQHQGLFQWVSSSHQVAKVLEFQFQQLTSVSDCSHLYFLSAMHVFLMKLLNSSSQAVLMGCHKGASPDHVWSDSFLIIWISNKDEVMWLQPWN